MDLDADAGDAAGDAEPVAAPALAPAPAAPAAKTRKLSPYTKLEDEFGGLVGKTVAQRRARQHDDCSWAATGSKSAHCDYPK